MIQGGGCGKMPSCILFSDIFDSCRVDIIQRPKGFLSKVLSVFRVEGAVISWVGWARFQLCRVLESQFFMS